MSFRIFHIFIASLYAQNFHQKWSGVNFKRSIRSIDLSVRNGTADWLDSFSDYERWLYQSFVSSSKIYPDKLDLLLKLGLKNLRGGIMVVRTGRAKPKAWHVIWISESNKRQFLQITIKTYQDLLEKINLKWILIWIFFGSILWTLQILLLVHHLSSISIGMMIV